MKLAPIFKRLLTEGQLQQLHDDPIFNAILMYIDMGKAASDLFDLLNEYPEKFANYTKVEYPLYRILYVKETKLLSAKNDNDIIYNPKPGYVSWTSDYDVPEDVIYTTDWFEDGRKEGYIAVIVESNNEQVALNINEWWEYNEDELEDEFNFMRNIVDEEQEVICKSRPIKKSDIIKIENVDDGGFDEV